MLYTPAMPRRGIVSLQTILKKDADGKFLCPEKGCNYKHALSRVIGTHRLNAHGIRGSQSLSDKGINPADLAKPALMRKDGKPFTRGPYKNSKHVTETDGAIVLHPDAPAPQSQPVSQTAVYRNHHAQPKEPKEITNAVKGQDNGITTEQEHAVAYTVGLLKAYTLQQAISFDQPAKQFTRWVAEYFQRAARRE